MDKNESARVFMLFEEACRLDESEREKLIEALEQTGGNRAEAARMLGVSKSTFHDRLKRYGVPPKFSSGK